MQLGTRQECVRSSPRVSGGCQDSAREFTKRRQTHRKIIKGSRKAYREFTEGIGKLARNMPGDHRRTTVRLIAVESEEGAVGLGMAGREATLVLRTSWFNCSSWIYAKEIAATRVYGCLTNLCQLFVDVVEIGWSEAV
ncbi:hypothetical protein GW17_00025518 [Ensete ventricosum]|nr:hypothetical protein GW17_00025518 [Ensete ventricosum]